MSDDARAAMPPPGWLFDEQTGRTRWWDGVRWTDLAKPLDPVVRTAPAYAPVSAAAAAFAAPATAAKNGPARAALILILLAVLGVTGILWLVTGGDPFIGASLGLLTIAMVLAAFILSIVGLVIAVRRPTRKGEAVFALIASTLLVGFLASRAVSVLTAAPGLLEVFSR